jgi:WD40 repeat protein
MEQNMPLSKTTAILNRLVLNKCKDWPTSLVKRAGSLSEEEPSKKVLNIVDFMDALASFLGSVFISIYANDPQKNFSHKDFNERIVKFFQKSPTLGEWIGILRCGLEHFQKNCDFLSEIKPFVSGVDDPLKIKNEKIKIFDLFNDLNSFRLSVGHPKELSDYLAKHKISYEVREDKDITGGHEQALPVLIPNLIRLISSLGFLSDYWLFYIKSVICEGNERVCHIHLYNSDRPHGEVLTVNDILQKIIENFEPDIYRRRLFFGKVKKIDNPIFPFTEIERVIEVNPVLINWLKEKEYLPYLFEKWKDKKKKNKVIMDELIYQKDKVPIEDIETVKRLKEFYYELKKRLNIEELEDEKEEPEEFFISHGQSEQRYHVVRKEIYPHLNIADEILAGIEIEKKREEQIIDVNVTISSDSNKEARVSLRRAVETLWNKPEKWNCILVGEGGMGKTTSLLKLWESFLPGDINSPVPIFLSLEKYNHIREEKRNNFIFETIFVEYFGHFPSSEEIRILQNFFMKNIKKDGKEYPSVILILDGLNEVTADRTDLLKNLNEIRKCKGCQIIISSRYDMRNNLSWSEFDGLTFEKLEDEQIKTFMLSREIEFSKELVESIPLLRNPMMLTLYCGLEREMKLSAGKEDYNFILNPQYKAELLHNFIESSLSRLDKQMVSECDKVMHRLFLRHMVPRTGYEMEKNGYVEISHSELTCIIREELKRYKTDEFLDSYPKIDSQSGKIKGLIDETDRIIVSDTINKLRENYCILKGQVGGPYSFLHQDFRDFFAAVYIKENIERRIEKNDDTFPEMAFYVFPQTLRIMLGELSGEPRRRPVLKDGYKKGEIKETFLDRALVLLRNKGIKSNTAKKIVFDYAVNLLHGEKEKKDYRLLNIIEILKDTRVDLSDTDLSYLDLSNIVFNHIILGRGEIDGELRGADLTGSLITGCNFFFYDSSNADSLAYSPDGSRIAGGFNYGIREWNVYTGEFIRDYSYENNSSKYGLLIKSLNYNRDRTKIISGDSTGIIKEWDTKTGQCLRTYKRERLLKFDSYNFYNFSYDRLKDKLKNSVALEKLNQLKMIIMNTSNRKFSDKQLRDIGFNNEEINIMLSNHITSYDYDGIYYIGYSSNSERIILITEFSSVIEELNLETRECIKIWSIPDASYADIIDFIAYSPEVNKIIYKTEEFDIKTGTSTRQPYDYKLKWSKLHSDIYDVSYSNDGERIVFALVDYDVYGVIIKEFDIKKRVLIREYDLSFKSSIIRREYDPQVSAVSYNPDGKKVLVAHDDEPIKEIDMATGEVIKRYNPYCFYLFSVCYSPDGKKIFFKRSNSFEQWIEEWDIVSGKFISIKDIEPVAYYYDFYNYVYEFCYRRNYSDYYEEGGKLVHKSERKKYNHEIDDNYYMWDGYEEEEPGISVIDYSSDEKKIVTGSGKLVKEWDKKTGECIKIYKGHSSSVNSVHYHPDCKQIISTDGETTCEWDVRSGKLLRSINHYPGLFIQGVNMSYLHPDSEISNEVKKIFKQYGAIIDEKAGLEKELSLSILHSANRYDEVKRELYPDRDIINDILPGIMRVSEPENEFFTLRNVIEYLWQTPEQWDCLLRGEYGSGKTATLLEVWKTFLFGYEGSPIPVYLSLKSYNYLEPEYRKHFIWYMILKEYQKITPCKDNICWLKNCFNKKNKINDRESPSLILLLDGFSEVKSNINDLLLCLNDAQKLEGVQIIITSRYDDRDELDLDLKEIFFEPLTDKQIMNFISDCDIEFNDYDIIDLLKNPLFLLLYTNLKNIDTTDIDNQITFIPEPANKTEKIQNLIFSYISYMLKNNKSLEEQLLIKLLTLYLLPRIGYEMEKNDIYEISHNDLIEIIKPELNIYLSSEFLSYNQDLSSLMTLEAKAYLDIMRVNTGLMINSLTEHSCIFKRTNKNNYNFIHNDLKIFFSAFYIKYNIQKKIESGDNSFPELSKHLFKLPLITMLGDLIGENERIPNAYFLNTEVKVNILDKVLDLLRNIEMTERDYRILNIFEILKNKRIDLSDTDLSYLDLRHIIFNNVILGCRGIDGKLRGANMKGCRLNFRNFLPAGHSSAITTTSYISDGDRLISGSQDGIIKEWNLNTGECIRTYCGHTNSIICLSYSPDRKKIASGSMDKTIREWDVTSGECLRIYLGHSGPVTCLSYNIEGSRIVSVSRDKTIREWCVESGKNLNIYENFDNVFYVKYSLDSKSIIMLKKEEIFIRDFEDIDFEDVPF